MKALGIIILSGLLILMIASVLYIYRTCCMTMLGTAIGLTVLLLAEIASFILIKKMMHNKGKRKWYTVITTIIFLFFCAVTIKHILFPPVKEIPATGSYQIGTEDYWVNTDTKDPYLSDGSLRELQIRKWFPADASDNFPVIVASHGSCGTIDNNVSLYQEMASYGYTVLAVAHPGQAAKVTYQNGKSAMVSSRFMKQMSAVQPQKSPEYAFEVYQEWMDIRIRDLNEIMDDFIDKNGKTDFVVMGHSLGGSAAYAMARLRKDVVGCIALESPFMYNIKAVKSGKFVFDDCDYSVPLLNIYSDSGYPHLYEWSEYQNNAHFLDSQNPLYTNIYYKGTGHMSLCDLSVASPILSAILSGKVQSMDAYEQLRQINSDCMEWLSSALNQNTIEPS